MAVPCGLPTSSCIWRPPSDGNVASERRERGYNPPPMAFSDAVSSIEASCRRLGFAVETQHVVAVDLALFVHGVRRASLHRTAPQHVGVSLRRVDPPHDQPGLPLFEVPDDEPALVAQAVSLWLAGEDEQSVRKHVPRLDQNHRRLEALRKQLLESAGPNAVEATITPMRLGRPDSWVVQMRGPCGGASLALSPTTDGCELLLTEGPRTCYRFTACDAERMLPQMMAWLTEAPSSRGLDPQWPWAAAGSAAAEYEHTAAAAFEESWRLLTTLLTAESGYPQHLQAQAIEFLRALEADGWNSHFRVATAVESVVLSRSFAFGLRGDQTRVSVWFGQPNAMRVDLGTPSRPIQHGSRSFLGYALRYLRQRPID